jgi:hypothetical protein
MGNRSITNSTIKKIYEETLNSVLIDSKSLCNSDNSIYQNITFGNIELINCTNNVISNVENRVNASITNECVQTNNFSNILEKGKEMFINKIGQSALPADKQIEIKRIVENTIDVNSISTCLSSTNLDQRILFNNIKVKCPNGGSFLIDNIGNYVYSEVISKCLQENDELVNEMNRVMDELPKDVVIDSPDLLSTEAIIGIVIGVLIIILLITGISALIYKRTR